MEFRNSLPYLCKADGNVAMASNLSLMANATYTPTHCPTTGRKFSKAERKAANKAKYAALRAEQAKTAKPKASKPAKPKASKPKATAKPKATPKVTKAGLMRLTKAELVALILKEDVKPAEVAKPKASAPKRTKPSRASKPTPDQRLEARMQRESLAKQEAKRIKEADKARKVVSKADGKQAQPFEERVEVAVPAKEHRAKREAVSELLGLQGLSVEDAARRDRMMAEREALEAALLADFESFEDAPF